MIAADKIKIGVVGALGLIVLSSGFFIGRCTKKDYSAELEWSKKLVSEKDAENKLIEKERTSVNVRLDDSKKENYQLRQRDSQMTSQFQSSQKIYNQLNDKLNSIPGFINRISSNNDSIRRAFAEP